MITIGRPPKRIYCRVVGWLERAWIDLTIVGSDEMNFGEQVHVSPIPTIRIDAELVPRDKRFPNTLVWFDRLDEAPWFKYVEPELAE